MKHTIGSATQVSSALLDRRSSRREVAQVALTLLTAYTTAISWQVQAVSYPLFRAVDDTDFAAYHQQYNEAILWPVLIPGFPTVIAGTLFYFFRPPRSSRRLAALVSATSLISLLLTLLWAIPMHDRLDAIGQDGPTIDSLLQANLLRSLALTLSTTALGWGLLRLVGGRVRRS